MTDRDAFEIRLERRLRSYAAVTIQPVDAEAVAESVAARSRPTISLWTHRRSGMSGLAWILLMLAVASAAALVVGSRLRVDAAPDRPLVFSTRLGGLYVAVATGKDPVAIGTVARYADPRWSPDGAWIAVVHGNPESLEELPVDELLVLRPSGEVVVRIEGPIRTFAWVGRSGSHSVVAAIRESDRHLIVVDTTGQQLAELDPAMFPGLPNALTGRPSSTGGAGILVSVGRSLVAVTDLSHGGRLEPAVATVRDGQINAASVSPDGSRVVFMHAPCLVNCLGDVILRSLDKDDGQVIADRVGADLAPSWTRAGDGVVVWPNLIPARGGLPIALHADARIRDFDVGHWWTRAAPDGRGVWFFRQFPGFNDRRWELWAIDQPAAAPRRLLKDVTGADLRP